MFKHQFKNVRMPPDLFHAAGNWISDALGCVTAYLGTTGRGMNGEKRRRSDNPGVSKIVVAITVHVIITAAAVAGGVLFAVRDLQKDVTNIKAAQQETKQDVRELRGIHLRRGEHYDQFVPKREEIR